MSVLKRGMSGEPVRMLQEKLGIPADGDFGPATEMAVRDAQKEHGLGADGIAGPDTFMALGMPELVLLRVGTRGEAVKKLQTALGLEADGRYGPATRKAVVALQQKLGVKADGMAGPLTLSRLDAFAAEVTTESIAKSKSPEPSAKPAAATSMPPTPTKPEPVSASAMSTPPVSESEATPDDEPPEDSVWSRVKGWFS